MQKQLLFRNYYGQLSQGKKEIESSERCRYNKRMEKAGTVNRKVFTRTIPRHLKIWGRTRKINVWISK